MADKTPQEQNIYTALLKVQEKAILPKKSTKGVYDNLYATLEDTWNASREVLNKNNLVVVQYVYGDNVITKLTYTPTGETIKSKLPLKNSKGDMQGLGSAITYARRYALTTIIGAIPEDDDGQASVGEVSETARPFVKDVAPTEKQINFIKNLLQQKVLISEKNEFLMDTIGEIVPSTMANAKKLIDVLIGMPALEQVQDDGLTAGDGYEAHNH